MKPRTMSTKPFALTLSPAEPPKRHTRPDVVTNPYRVDGPTCISFSGGRTSAYMLRRILDAHDGVLPADCHVLFANTGKERPETLDFVQACSERWNIRVRWVEWAQAAPGYREVDFKSASRDGAPFAELIRWKRYLPNPVMRMCTQHLKVDAFKRFIIAELGFTEWTSCLGIRADEPRRFRILGQDRYNPMDWKVAPLIQDGITEADVMAFWEEAPFDLALQPHEGNCDLCFLKGTRKRLTIIRDRPDLAQWWIDREAEVGHSFRAHTPAYGTLLQMVRQQPQFPCQPAGDDDLGDCLCGG